MNDTGRFNEKRLSDHDYSRPGTYHLLFELGEHSSKLGSVRKGVMTLNAYGEIFLGVLGMALQIFSCLRLDALDIRPQCVEMVVSISRWRKPFFRKFKSDHERWHYRRTMTISVFAGYLKMNSGRSINKKRKRGGTHFWAIGFKDRVLTNKDEIRSICARLQANFMRVRCARNTEADKKRASTLGSAIVASLGASIDAVFTALYGAVPAVGPVPEAPELPFDTMLLGKALFLNSALLRPDPPFSEQTGNGADEATGVHGGRTPEPLIFGIGPGRIFLTAPADC